MEQNDILNEFLYNQATAHEHIEQYEIPFEQSKKLLSFYMISQDIDLMINCIDTAVKFGKVNKDNLLLITALWEKMLIAYGKIFSKSEDAFSTLNKNLVDKADMVLHEQIMLIRNSYLAHRGVNTFEHNLLIASLVGTENNCRIEFIVPWVKLMGHYGNPIEVRRYLKRLKKKVNQRLIYIREKLEQKIYVDLGLEPNLDIS